jgi:ribosomal protein S18 acetylase RimI-like enzyme
MDIDFEPLGIGHAAALGEFFLALAADPTSIRYFHPHPMTCDYAESLCRRGTSMKDRYFVACRGGAVLAYGMLRGWDEGYQVPSFGCAIHPKARGLGLARRILEHAIAEARRHGAERLRLTVYKTNLPAVHIYEKAGFVLSEKNEREWLGMLDLSEPACVPRTAA